LLKHRKIVNVMATALQSRRMLKAGLCTINHSQQSQSHWHIKDFSFKAKAKNLQEKQSQGQGLRTKDKE